MNHEGSDRILCFFIIALNFSENCILPQFGIKLFLPNLRTRIILSREDDLLRDVENMPISNLYLVHHELFDNQLHLQFYGHLYSRGSELAPHQLEV